VCGKCAASVGEVRVSMGEKCVSVGRWRVSVRGVCECGGEEGGSGREGCASVSVCV